MVWVSVCRAETEPLSCGAVADLAMGHPALPTASQCKPPCCVEILACGYVSVLQSQLMELLNETYFKLHQVSEPVTAAHTVLWRSSVIMHFPLPLSSPFSLRGNWQSPLSSPPPPNLLTHLFRSCPPAVRRLWVDTWWLSPQATPYSYSSSMPSTSESGVRGRVWQGHRGMWVWQWLAVWRSWVWS